LFTKHSTCAKRKFLAPLSESMEWSRKGILDLSTHNTKFRLKEALGDYSAIRTLKCYIVTTSWENIFLFLLKSFYVKKHLVTINSFYIYCNVNYTCYPKCVIQILLIIFYKIKKIQMLLQPQFEQNVHRVNMCIIILYCIILLNNT
jgi:hypothetical protein